MADRRDVPESVFFHILLFLPVISLTRFKTVCKSWCSLIESSFFVTQHLCYNSENKNTLLVSNYENEFSLLSGRRYQMHSNLMCQEIFPKTRFDIVNSCNGIVCLTTITNLVTHDYILCSLWNPATKQIRQLPEPTLLRARYGARRKLNHKFALGFDNITNDYKIVRISLDRGVNSLNNSLVQVYNMRTDSWRTIHEGNDFPILWTYPSVDVASNGEMCLWIGMCLSLRMTVIFYFDLANEVYGTMPLPDNHTNAQACNLAFLGEKITYIECKGHPCYRIWMMDEFSKKESWNKIYQLEEPILSCQYVSLVNLSKNGEFILTIKNGGTNDGLYLYDLVTQEEMLLLDAPKVRRMTNYSESLVSIMSTKLI